MIKENSAFTLIELLIVIAIMGIIATISLVALQGARESGRDARRKSDLETIRSALELYRSDCHDYPASLPAAGSSLRGDGSPAACSASNTYLSSVPRDPSSGRQYAYNRTSGSSYVICASLEQAPNPAMSTTGCGSCGSACNYRVTSP